MKSIPLTYEALLSKICEDYGVSPAARRAIVKLMLSILEAESPKAQKNVT